MSNVRDNVSHRLLGIKVSVHYIRPTQSSVIGQGIPSFLPFDRFLTWSMCRIAAVLANVNVSNWSGSGGTGMMSKVAEDERKEEASVNY